MLAGLFAALAEEDVAAERVVYAEDATDEIRKQLLRLDAVLVWVNPIQDGANRGQLDAPLHEVSGQGVWVSAHPDVIAKLGTKEVLYNTRDLGWGTDVDLYQSPGELMERLPSRLAAAGTLVLKQARGNTGNGVWRVELVDRASFQTDDRPTRDSIVKVRQAQPPPNRSLDIRCVATLRRPLRDEGIGAAIRGPVQRYLAIAAAALGDEPRARSHFARAVDAAQKFGAPRLVVRVQRELSALAPTGRDVNVGDNVFRRERLMAQFWRNHSSGLSAGGP